ncbi:protein-methionine-sulfoxide reductase catalytic subunit MsrP [Aliikangiella sp. G2MR2-5]|uniref:protein-methionine-sulfoxide reductase catalytic subunit MsrP n=1 Tax=Aliikangiella sp. G2MR2-5 TaxID=2788943 RepID=UPI0018A9E963|nr:protein-methionine-sulfoxide reductase catalytic subunit MsrP [Aliikangiella sp. G2MR2-5]
MAIVRKSDSLGETSVTPEAIFWKRREFIKSFTGALSVSALAPGIVLSDNTVAQKSSKMIGEELRGELSSEFVVTHHNNFYEFSTDKQEPSRKARNFKPDSNWKINISGEVDKPGDYTLERILSRVNEEERIYRLRCVEAWSMVVPWTGFELNQLISLVKPTSKAKFVEFKTLHDPEVFPGQKRGAFGSYTLPWPYSEGLTIQEANHPLTILATGVYGKPLPGQNGAPLRLVVPWKYGFKSIKSIVSIRFTQEQPVSTWNERLPNEYGFYANVNPKVDHPRWSQATERRITDESFFGVKRIPTKPFNGYAGEVAHLYKGLDLRKFF